MTLGVGDSSRGNDPAALCGSLAWLDLLKSFAISWIFFNHDSEAVFDGPHFANPSEHWPPLTERIAQAMPLEQGGLTGLVANAFRYVGWTGDQGVQLFIIASGFGLAYSLMRRGGVPVTDLKDFFLRRVLRLFPLWWGAHILFAAFRFATGVGPSPLEGAFYLSLLGVRCTPETYAYAAPAWWYIGLQLQLYLVFPLLWSWLRRFGALKVLLATAAVAFAARIAGFLVFDAYLDPWQRGAVFITRLPEFVVGMALAVWFFERPEVAHRTLTRPLALLGGLALWAAATVGSFTAPGVVVAPLLTGVGLLPPVYALCNLVARRLRRTAGAGHWVGRHSYGIYLVHHPILLLLMGPAGMAWALVTMAIGAALSLVATVGLEAAVARAEAALLRARGLARKLAAMLRVGALTGVVGALFLGGLVLGERTVRQRAPQEVLGWGERASLQADPHLGWRLRSSRKTRLRWESYDYTVNANVLGFPGPDPAPQKAAGGLRLMVLGDAFSSAEGVDTARAWPRLLERRLDELLAPRTVEVNNFAITGYGPNQYAAVAERYVPQLRPDSVIVALFINDFEDAAIETPDFQRAIGFDRPDPATVPGWRKPLQLRAFVNKRLWAGLRQRVTGQLSPRIAFWSGVNWLRPGASFYMPPIVERVRDRLARIQRAAGRVGAKTTLVLIPAPLQVCRVDQLAYLPPGLEVSATTGYDLELPQRELKRLAKQLGLPSVDLRPALRRAGCPYQRANLHFTEVGHRVVAGELVKLW